MRAAGRCAARAHRRAGSRCNRTATRTRSRGRRDVGEPPDPRTLRHAHKRGYDLTTQRAQQVARQHFLDFDYILAMDRTHLRMLKALAPADAKANLGLFLEASGRWKGEDVPDPYYGGVQGFEQ